MAKLVLYNSYDGVGHKYEDVKYIDILEDYLRIEFSRPKKIYSTNMTPEASRVTTLYISKSQFTAMAWMED